ncbi:CPBP family intramembrane glutamic endopeptidase [Bacillus sp. FJAT-49736]|uniref:CPBP family intramembrane glutamic endopeptidase n=1 Tax=Bacillus sp. FJAT-49736 TaxID=2833582 RepID=UPI001BC9A05E|nr:CPBP family intramembrane glutamic endopeptidase [Bacillus sp. FJAT-49736]MBS4174744.1 CPBP family intramembrane metalloprotease [Bacillus sp. FJAT-49736]
MIKFKQGNYYYLKVLLGLILLDIYLNVFIAKTSNIVIQLLLVILFFPLLKIILKATKLNSFKSIGIVFHQKWKKNLIIGFSIGFTFWLIKYAIVYSFHGFEIVSVKNVTESLIAFFFVFFAFFIASFLNDIIIRGYIFGHLKKRMNGKWIFIISLFLYAVDDSWNEGFSLSNTLFSLAVGLSLTYAYYRTQSIWVDTGIHWGLNVCYGIFNGMIGSSDGGIFVTAFHPHPSIFIELISYFIPLLMFLFLYLLRGKLTVFTNSFNATKE